MPAVHGIVSFEAWNIWDSHGSYDSDGGLMCCKCVESYRSANGWLLIGAIYVC